MKIRLDQYLVQHGLIQSRERARAMIMSGVVFVNEQKVDKAGEMIKEDAKVEVRGHDIGYVSRGGLKLEKAMQCFPLTPKGKVCMDIQTCFKCPAREIHSPSGFAAILVSVNFNSEPYLSLKYSSGSKVRASAGVRWYTGGSK